MPGEGGIAHAGPVNPESVSCGLSGSAFGGQAEEINYVFHKGVDGKVIVDLPPKTSSVATVQFPEQPQQRRF